MEPVGLAITSIGLDGEETDQLTALPKPEIRVRKGLVVATAEKTLAKATCTYESLRDLDIDTPLGRIQIVRVTSHGSMLVGGPSTVTDLEVLLEELHAEQIHQVWIDGAFSRQSSTMLSDGVIYAVGGAYSNDLDLVIDHAKTDIQILSIPRVEHDQSALASIHGIAIYRQGVWKERHESSLFEMSSIDTLLTEGIEKIYLPGALTEEFVKTWLKMPSLTRPKLILSHPTGIIQDRVLRGFLCRYLDDIRVLHPISLVAVTVNPSSPYRPDFDKEDMLRRLQQVSKYPVFNLREEGETS